MQLLAAEVQNPAVTLHYPLTSAAYTVGERREVNLKQITHFRVCVYINWATHNSVCYVEATFVYCIMGIICL